MSCWEGWYDAYKRRYGMASNLVTINHKIEYIVSDKKMTELMRWLDKNGLKTDTLGLRKKNEDSKPV